MTKAHDDADDELRAAARALGRRGGKKGGPARASALSPERRSEIARAAAHKRWAHREPMLRLGDWVIYTRGRTRRIARVTDLWSGCRADPPYRPESQLPWGQVRASRDVQVRLQALAGSPVPDLVWGADIAPAPEVAPT
jgi:hypothetical protein